jgi:hypothetical protein
MQMDMLIAHMPGQGGKSFPRANLLENSFEFLFSTKDASPDGGRGPAFGGNVSRF